MMPSAVPSKPIYGALLPISGYKVDFFSKLQFQAFFIREGVQFYMFKNIKPFDGDSYCNNA